MTLYDMVKSTTYCDVGKLWYTRMSQESSTLPRRPSQEVFGGPSTYSQGIWKTRE